MVLDPPKWASKESGPSIRGYGPGTTLVLGLEEAWERERKSVSRFELDAKLVEWKKEFPWLAEAPSQALQQVNKGFPQGIQVLPDISGRFRAVRLPKLGPVKFRKTREIQGTLQNATLSRQAGAWFFSLGCKDVPVSPRIEGSGIVGIDRGIAAFAALSDGTLAKGPEAGKKARRKLAKLQRALASKQRCSQNWRKQKTKIQKLQAHTARVRRDFLHKLSTAIVQNHAVVVLEALKTRNLTQSAKGTLEEPGRNVRAKAGLNRALLDQGWHAFEVMLAYKLAWRCGELVKIDRKSVV